MLIIFTYDKLKVYQSLAVKCKMSVIVTLAVKFYINQNKKKKKKWYVNSENNSETLLLNFVKYSSKLIFFNNFQKIF